MYSQNDEEKVIVEFLNTDRGRFLDIGACDGIYLSNTRKLLEMGWDGVLVEPRAESFCKLFRNCAPFSRRVSLIQAAVSSKTELNRLWLDLYPDREWSATINRDLLGIGSVMNPSPIPVFIPCITAEALCAFGPYDFICIDAEWEDFSILKSAPKEFWKGCKLLCVETRGSLERIEMRAYLATIGFRKIVHETKENLLVAP